MHHTPIYTSIYIFIPPKFNFKPKNIYKPKGNIYKKQALPLLKLLPNSETNIYFYIQDIGKIQFYIGFAHTSPKPPLNYIASLYAYTLHICKPLISFINYKSIYIYIKHILI